MTLTNAIGEVCPSIAVIATAVGQRERPEGLNPPVQSFPRPCNSLDIIDATQDTVMFR